MNQQAAENSLDELDHKWGEKYPIVIKSWRKKWHNLSIFFKYPEPIRKVIYTTNAVESVHRQFRKLTKTKGAFPNENSLLKLLFVGIQNMTKGLLKHHKEAVIKTIPKGRLGEPEDIAGTALYLGSRASDYMIGETLVLDGAWKNQY